MSHVKILEQELRKIVDLSSCEDKSDEVEMLTDLLVNDYKLLDLGYLESICQFYFGGKEATMFFRVDSAEVVDKFEDAVKEVKLVPKTTYTWEEA